MLTCPRGHHIKAPTNWWLDTLWCAECRQVYAAEHMRQAQRQTERLSLFETSTKDAPHG